MNGIPGTRCSGYYDDHDHTYDCRLQYDHNPPHQYAVSNRADGAGSRMVIEWWDSWGNDHESGKRWDGA